MGWKITPGQFLQAAGGIFNQWILLASPRIEENDQVFHRQVKGMRCEALQRLAVQPLLAGRQGGLDIQGNSLRQGQRKEPQGLGSSWNIFIEGLERPAKVPG